MIPPPPASSPIHRPRDRGSWTLPGPAPVTPGPYGLDSHAGCRTRDVARPAPGYGRVLDSHADAGCRTRDAARASGRSCSWAYGVGRGTALVPASNGRNLRGRLRRPVRVDGLQRRPPGSSACRMLGQRSRLVRAIPRARSTDNSPSGRCRREPSSQRQGPLPGFEAPQAPSRPVSRGGRRASFTRLAFASRLPVDRQPADTSSLDRRPAQEWVSINQKRSEHALRVRRTTLKRFILN